MKLALTAAAVAVLVLAPTAAHAESKVHRDPAGDVASFNLSDSNPDSEDFTPTPAPTQSDGDITSIRVTHLARTVRVSLAFHELNRSGLGKFFEYRVRSNKGVRDLEVSAFSGSWAGDHSLTDNDGDNVRCKGIRHRIDYVRNTALVVIPRSCLGDPRWVRVAAVSGSVAEDHTTFFIDDARSSNYFGEKYVYGPKVRKG
jgi:hypothetical protein